MGSWTEDQLATIGDAEEVGVASRRDDGTLRRSVTIWAVRSGDALYIRSVHGRSRWLPRALAAGKGRIDASGTEFEVAFVQADPDVNAAVTAAYHAKYDRYGPGVVGTVVSPEAERSTLRLEPLAGS